MNKQSQKSGNNSTNVQAGNIIVHQGLTYSEVKKIALDVFKANFYELVAKAQETAKQRAEEITEDFLQKLQKENPNGFLKSEDPDFQYALFTVQKEYARNGDKELGDLLVDLLVDRSKQEQRNILQIVLNESLHVAPKLTSDQLSSLAVIFLLRYTANKQINDHVNLGKYLDRYLEPFVKNISKSESCYQHLEYSGCGSVDVTRLLLEESLQRNYQSLFNKMNNVEIQEKCIEIRPYMKQVFDTWSKSSMKNFKLTSVGIAIGHANIKRLCGEYGDLSTWIK